LVLAGGGMRGAYEVGVLQGIIDVLGLGPKANSPFQFVAGTSVGAINSAFVAANAHERDLGLEKLADAWCGLRFGHDVRSRVGAWVEQLLRGTAPPNPSDVYLGSSLFDPEPLEDLVSSAVDWQRLHQNIENQRISGLLIAALEVASGRTTIFHELSPQLHFAASKDPRQVALREPINASHVLASAAIPLLFPARRIGDDFYCDGGLRFNTPIAPVIRAGARRVVVVSTARRARRLRSKPHVKIQYYPTAGFLLGKMLNALLLDPLDYDLHMLQRINRLLELHSSALDEGGQRAAEELFTETRGTFYRPIDILVFSPSRDIGRMAREYLRANFETLDIGWIMRWFLRGATEPGSGSDWVAYLLFDGGFARQLIDLGRRDAHRRTEEIRRFFGLEGRQPSAAIDLVL
jgi:NTE family protein